MMKKRLFLFLFCLLNTYWAAAQYSGSGNGTENDPYLIYNETQLAQVANFLNQEGVVFKLMKDLNLTNWISENNPSQGWIPIGVDSSPFKGKFYGNNHKISGMMISRASTDNVGFFGYISGATINNLTIEGNNVTGATNVGGFIGYATGSEITNCNLSLTSGVKGTNNVGGFIGQSYYSNFSTFSVITDVNAQSCLGGFVGIVEGGTFSEGIISGVRTSTGDYIGGFAGKMKDVAVSDIKHQGNINGKNYLGGFVGDCSNGTFTRCSVECNVSGTQYVSGFAGALETVASTLNTCFHKGIVTATGDYAGGIVGISKGACIEEMESCSHFGEMQGNNYVGGLIGAILNLTSVPTLNEYALKSSDKNSPSIETYLSYIEYIRNGSNSNALINNCVAIGNIQGDDWIGGLIGSDSPSYSYTLILEPVIFDIKKYRYLWKNDVYTGRHSNNKEWVLPTYYLRRSSSLSFTNNYYSGTIHAQNNVGGLCGYKSGGSIQNNYSYGSIYGSSNVGGIIGKIDAQKDNDAYNTTTIKSNIANITTVSATDSNVGRIYGITDEDGANIGALGSSESNRALTQAQVMLCGVSQVIDDDLQNGGSIGSSALKLKANYVSWGWDFNNDWNILETECYPYKKYQAAPPVIESELVSQATSVSGKSVNGGTVYFYYKSDTPRSFTCNGNNWSFDTTPLQSGAAIQVYADVEGMAPSYFTYATVGYPGSGTEEDPYRIYTAADLQGVTKQGYYKLMNDIDLTQWINENNPTGGWIPVGRNGSESIYIDGENHTVTGLWINTTDDYNGLFSSLPSGYIKNLNVEVASGKSVKGGDYTGILVGKIYCDSGSSFSITNCHVNGNVIGGAVTGGMVGGIEGNGTTGIRDCSATGNVQVTMTDVRNKSIRVGGLVGYADNITLHSVSLTGDINVNVETNENSVNLDVHVGGLAGNVSGDMMSCASTCSISTTSVSNGRNGELLYVGGLVGSSSGQVTNCRASSTITASHPNACEAMVGGLVGSASSKVSLSFSEGSITSNPTIDYPECDFTGGLVGGYLSSYNRIENCYSTADVNGSYYTGGLVGYTKGKIDKCYSTGNVYGVNYGGGIVAELDGSGAALTNSVACCNTLSLSDQSSWGSRVVGGFKNGAAEPDNSNYALNTMQVSLNNVPQTKTDDPVEGIAITEAQLMNSDTYIGLGWDFTDVWYMNSTTGLPNFIWNKDKDAQSLDLAQLPAMSYGDAAYTLPQQTTQGMAVTWTSSNPEVALVSGNTLTIKGAGTSSITATQAGNENYSAFSREFTLTVGKASLTITADNKTKQEGTENPELTVRYSGFVYGEDASVLSTPPAVTTTATASSGVGTYPITVSGAEANNYEITYVNGTLTVTEEPVVLDDTDISQIDNVVYIESFEARAGESLKLSIKMKNTVGIQTAQFDLYLPDGVEVLTDEDGYELIELSTERTTARKMDAFSVVRTATGAYRVLINSTRGNTFDGNDGEIATAQIKLADDLAVGDYPIVFKDIVLVNTSSQGFETDYVKFTLSVPDYMPGDVNNDGKVNAIDLNAITNYILEHRTFPFTFNTKAGDVNSDTKINAIDLNAVTNMILHQSSASGIKFRAVEVGVIEE